MIAILMCTYNGEKYLREQIDSILEQDICDGKKTDKEKVELYILDDMSSDKTASIISDYVNRYPETVHKLNCSDKHEGVKNNFFIGLLSEEIRSADYVMISDQDDIWDNRKISATLKRMKETEMARGKDTPILVHCDCEVVDESLRIISPSFREFANFNQSKSSFNHLLVQNHVTGAASMMNKALISLITEIPENCMMYDHFLALVASAFGTIEYIDEQLYRYRQHNSNVLSAVEGGITKEVRIWKRNEQAKKEKQRVLQMVRDNYLGMKLQAQAFYKIYGDKLDKYNKRVLTEFINLSDKNRFGRVFTILRYNITCDNWYRVIGECSFYFRERV